MGQRKPKLVFIAGYPRSGSTLLDRLLGQVEGFISLGEFYWIWERGFAKDQLCGCGKPFTECGFWQLVMEEAFGGAGTADIGEIRELQHAVEGRRYLPQATFPGKREKLLAYSEILGKLYKAIQKVSGANVIVDSSKFPAHGFVLNCIPCVELHVVHCVRDSRAVAYSWQRKRLRPEVRSRRSYMPVKRPVHSALAWNAGNGLVHVLHHFVRNYSLWRYEDTAKDPRRVLLGILRRLGEPRGALDFLNGFEASLRPGHTVAGNPVRFKTGALEIRPDTEWQEKLSALDRALVTALTWPLLRKYGYRL